MSTVARLCRSVVLFSFAALSAPAQQTLRVPQDFPSIQTAINAAATGDTVLVAPGTYFENLTIATKEITLTSTAGAATTLLDGQHLGPVLELTGANGLRTVINGFTFQNGTAPPPPTNTPILTGGGIYATNSGLTVAGSSFRNIIGPSLVASKSTLHLIGSTVTTTDGTPCTNAGVGSHSGVYLLDDSVVTENGSPAPSTFIGNTIFGDGSFCSGVGVELSGISVPVLLQNNILRNNLQALFASYSAFNLVQNLIYDNGLGAVGIEGQRPTGPSTGPPTMFLTSNTMVNNHTSPDTLNGPFVTEINVRNVAARVAMRNNIVIGTTQYAVLACASDGGYSTASDTPLLLDHNDLYNTSGGLVLSGTCFPNLAPPLSSNGNLSADPRFGSSTDLHPLSGSPVLDAGLNSVDALATDLDGNPRITDSTGKGYPLIDLGAYERAGAPSSVIATALSLQSTASTLAPGVLSVSLTAAKLTSSGIAPLTSGTITVFVNGAAVSGTASLDSSGNASASVPLFTPGVYALTASLAPSLGFAPAASPVLYVLVSPSITAPTTLTIAASPTTQVLNQPVTLTIHLGSTTTANGATQPGPVPPGAVTLLEGSTILSSLQPDASGLATYTIPKPTFGTHTYTVTYAGTTAFSAASATTSVGITAPVATSLTAIATPNPAPLGSAIQCVATVVAASGPAPTGVVVFTDGATPEGSVSLTSSAEQGIATVVISSLSFGLHTLTVTFQPDAGFSASSGTCTVNVGGDATRTTLTSAKNPAAITETVLYTATVFSTATGSSATAPTGSVTLSEGTTLLASAPLVPGSNGSSLASLPASLSTAGTHILTATYIPGTSASFSSSGTLTETITPAPVITTVLAAAPSPSTIGETVTLSATVSSLAPLPGAASITFTDGSAILGTVPLSAAGVAVFSVNTLSLGVHQLSAVLHTPDSPLARSTATPVSLQVNGLTATLALTASPAASTFATLPVTLTATLTSPPLPTGFLLNGSVTFFDGGLPLGTAAISANRQAVLTAPGLAVGTHTLTATFSGNTLLAPATSAAIIETIALNSTSLQLVAPTQSTAFAPVTLAAHVAATTTAAHLNTAFCQPACSPVAVTFFADTPAGRSSLGTVALDALGNASLAITPAAGTYSLSAAFSGSALFAASTSAVSTLTVSAAATTLSLRANPNPVYQHGAVTLAATLAAPGVPASALTGGTITFLEGSTSLGTATLAAAQSFAYSPTAVGTHTLTAVFSGSASLSGASATATVTVLPSDFVLSVKDPTLTIATTHHAPTIISVDATGALADQIDLSCSNLPEFAQCTFSPATRDLTSSNTSSGTLMVDTDALLNYARADSPSGHETGGSLTAVLALCIPISLLASLSRLCRRRGRISGRAAMPHLLATLLLSVAAVTLSGCSGLYPPHVAPGTYTVTITGHARATGIEHTTPLTLIVTP